MKRLIAGVSLACALVIVGLDSYKHFDQERVQVKRKHNSDQRNWSLFYSQQHVFKDSPIRYAGDFKAMSSLVEKGSLLLSDKATSYYAASILPVYVMNIQRHHGRWQRRAWQNFIDDRYFCYQEFEENRERVDVFLRVRKEADYVIVNRDRQLSHRHQDCLAFRSHTLTEHLPRIANLVYQGEYLDLYSMN